MKKSILITMMVLFCADDAHAKSCLDQPSIKIGFAAPTFALDGEVNDGGGALMAFDEVNKNGGILIDDQLRCFELIRADDAGDVQRGMEVAEDFVKNDVVAVIGHLNSAVSMAANSIYAKNSIVQISPSSTNPSYTLKRNPSNKTPDGYISHYRVITHDGYVGAALAKYATINKAKSIAQFELVGEYGWVISNGVDNELEKLGNIRLVSRKFYSDKDLDFTPDLNEIKMYGLENNATPDFLFWAGLPEQGVVLVRQMKRLGLNTKLITTFETCRNSFVKYAGEAANGVVCTREYLPVQVVSGLAEFKKKYEKWDKTREYQLYTPYTYDAAKAIINAIQDVGSVEPQKIAFAMQKVSFQGVTGEINFDENGDVNNGAVAIYEVVNGTYTFRKLFRTKTDRLALY